ncbi:MAG: S-layer homology domain-containing protein, partial [Bifidobacteriaceae bacterium]|nr:S-layer homology domain-containing protein [Bifidobacteriaceae bacterium]
MTKSNIAKIACAILLSTVLCATSFQSALSLPAPIKPAPITVLSASSAPAPPSDVKLIKDKHNLVVKWKKSNTVDVKYKIEVLNKVGGTVYAVDNLSNSLSEYTFSNVRANNYASVKVYAVLDGQTSFAQSTAGVYFELSPVDRESSFADISKLSEESKKAIIWCFGYGVTVGTDSKHYSPSRILTREQMAVFLYRMSGSPKIDPNLKASFRDIKNSFSKKAIIWLYNSGITSGTSKNYFSPKKQVSRSQM